MKFAADSVARVLDGHCSSGSIGNQRTPTEHDEHDRVLLDQVIKSIVIFTD